MSEVLAGIFSEAIAGHLSESLMTAEKGIVAEDYYGFIHGEISCFLLS